MLKNTSSADIFKAIWLQNLGLGLVFGFFLIFWGGGGGGFFGWVFCLVFLFFFKILILSTLFPLRPRLELKAIKCTFSLSSKS